MIRNAKASKARIRTALAKAKDITRRQKDLETCLVEAHKVALAAALAEDYATLLSEYPDVFPTPPVQLEQIRAHARELREAQAAVEAEEAESRGQAQARRRAQRADALTREDSEAELTALAARDGRPCPRSRAGLSSRSPLRAG